MAQWIVVVIRATERVVTCAQWLSNGLNLSGVSRNLQASLPGKQGGSGAGFGARSPSSDSVPFGAAPSSGVAMARPPRRPPRRGTTFGSMYLKPFLGRNASSECQGLEIPMNFAELHLASVAVHFPVGLLLLVLSARQRNKWNNG